VGRAVTLLGAVAMDLAAGEPPAWMHPTVAMGSVVGALERRAPARGPAQLAFGALLVGVPAALGAGLGIFVERLPVLWRVPLSVSLLKAALSLRELLAAGQRMERALEAGDLGAARSAARDLVSRPAAGLDAPALASAAIESLAENLADSYVAPLLFFRAFGLPGALAYRAVNTADAMVGYRGRYELLGKAAARLDDVLSYVPSRVAALALVVAAPIAGLSPRAALRTGFRDHRRTASPNAGWPMAVAAGACGVRLEKPDHYVLGEGRAPEASDIARSRRLVFTAAALTTLALVLTWGRRTR
jgi:adenosylcobinamide-phosphate synthase